MVLNDETNYKKKIMKARASLPFPISCDSFGHHMKHTTIFKSTGKEFVAGETYLGIRIVRFYFKCSKCSAEIKIKTDPQNEGCILESGATKRQNVSPATPGIQQIRCMLPPVTS